MVWIIIVIEESFSLDIVGLSLQSSFPTSHVFSIHSSMTRSLKNAEELCRIPHLIRGLEGCERYKRLKLHQIIVKK